MKPIELAPLCVTLTSNIPDQCHMVNLLRCITTRAARCTENIGASRFALYGSGFDSGIPDFGSVRTLHCAFKTTLVEVV